VQTGVVSTYRLDPWLAQADPNIKDPNTVLCPICRNLGETGPDPAFLGPPNPGTNTPSAVLVCPPFYADPNLRDTSVPFYDECDDDMEARYIYNRRGIATNGEVQKSDSEFLLGSRIGYNITNHWEVELDLGFAKQRLDMTKNLTNFLTEAVSNPADPWFARQADFFEFTWANRDFTLIGYAPTIDSNDPNIVTGIGGIHEIPNVPQRRFSKNPAADIPAVLPMPLASAERFEDVTDFINRVLLDPSAWRNRANQINIDIFSAGLSGVYNFNTKPDSRIVPYVQAGLGRWMRSFDAPYSGDSTNYINYGGGARFFVNEIFSFRFDFRNVMFREDTTTISGSLPRQNILDVNTNWSTILGFEGCFRDQEPAVQQPPMECGINAITEINNRRRFTLDDLPTNPKAGGNASLEITTETDSFMEFRIGFDVLLGGK
jgi:hypothetical protein